MFCCKAKIDEIMYEPCVLVTNNSLMELPKPPFPEVITKTAFIYLSFWVEAMKHAEILYLYPGWHMLNDVFLSICICIYRFARKPQATGILHLYSVWQPPPASMMYLWVFVFAFVFVFVFLIIVLWGSHRLQAHFIFIQADTGCQPRWCVCEYLYLYLYSVFC